MNDLYDIKKLLRSALTTAVILLKLQNVLLVSHKLIYLFSISLLKQYIKKRIQWNIISPKQLGIITIMKNRNCLSGNPKRNCPYSLRRNWTTWPLQVPSKIQKTLWLWAIFTEQHQHVWQHTSIRAVKKKKRYKKNLKLSNSRISNKI